MCAERYVAAAKILVGEVVAFLQVAVKECLTYFSEMFWPAIIVLERIALSCPECDFIKSHTLAVNAAVDHGADAPVA